MIQRVRKVTVIFVSVGALLAAVWGIVLTLRSPLFLVQVVEVIDQPDQVPVSAEMITALADVPIGKVSLFDLDLEAIERRILQDPWIRSVALQKRFPQTLSISVSYRDPQALMQLPNDSLAYVDRDGKVFGKVTLNFQPDLPILVGFANESTARVVEALQVLQNWQMSQVSKRAEVSSLLWDSERGFRVLASYPVAGKRGRSTVDLGPEVNGSAVKQLDRLSRVFDYLMAHSIAARQIWADAGKKIVVKTARGS